ncbi:hypothetical protein [Portibacter lacus]|uniref:Uncharacterized protein n=1 Tax=Portibacter lacus TaxID=1099794 RepID=A0AA37SUV2_9BACT|nr:hypothetical protein [Portibacter lacus]GLR19495.1 hypothetical protein GCM10007940_41110 [Portibacter lacus]
MKRVYFVEIAISIILLSQIFPNILYGADPPALKIVRDDHVATVEMDFKEGESFGGHLWDIDVDGTDPIGYLLEWWPDPLDTIQMIKGEGCSTGQHTGTKVFATAESPHKLVTASHMAQLQPIANNLTYHLKVTKLNSLGQAASNPTIVSFEGGDSTRVHLLKNSMTFFDDFNLPEGPANELKWNNAMTPQTDPRFNMFFINKQCHSHTLNGTLNGAAGDKSQVAQRPRKPILIEENQRRHVVFDMDGIFSPRGVWYLDFNPMETDLTGHMSFFDANGDVGLPADLLRIRAKNHEISVSLINSAGESYQVAHANLPEFGRRMSTNVRRAFSLSLGSDGIEIKVDGTTVINTLFDEGNFSPGVYHLLWTTIGYNTSKDDNPYFLSHWDNFGFDGPDLDPFVTHNYVTRIIGTDLQKASTYNNQNPIFKIEVPDDIRPITSSISNEVWLVFTYMKNDYSYFDIGIDDYLLFNGNKYDLPEAPNNSRPLNNSLVGYDGSAISNRIKIGEVEMGGNSPVIIGENQVQFFAQNTGIVNVHIEIKCPENGAYPIYTPPSQIHPYKNHGDLPKLGVPTKIVKIDSLYPSEEGDSLYSTELSGTVPVEILAGNRAWAGWAPYLLHSPAQSAELWSTGNTQGIKFIELYIKPVGSDSMPSLRLATITTNALAPAPQSRYEFKIDTRKVNNGEYELFAIAENENGLKSHPNYDGFAFKWDAEEISGAYYPIRVTINNPVIAEYIFNGVHGEQWTEDSSWDNGLMPPYNYDGLIKIAANCEIPEIYSLALGKNAVLNINSNSTLKIK